MPRYSIAFIVPKPALIHRLIEMDSRDAALSFFFQEHITQGYSKDTEGFNYFLEDFNSPEDPMGSILEV